MKVCENRDTAGFMPLRLVAHDCVAEIDPAHQGRVKTTTEPGAVATGGHHSKSGIHIVETPPERTLT